MTAQIRCPRCGAPSDLVNPGIAVLTCDSCQGLIYRSDGQVQIGAEAMVPPSDARLSMHASGRLQGLGFRVVGQVRYDYGRGRWDEWYLQADDGQAVWLSEDERELIRQQPADPESPVPGPDEIGVGAAIEHGGVVYRVREVGDARCVGVQGQLPFPVVPDETYTYANLVSDDGEHIASLEYDEESEPTFFVGRPIEHGELELDEGFGGLEAAQIEARSIACKNCGGPVEVPGGRVVETRVCDYCGAQLDLTRAEQQVLGVNPEGAEPGFALEIGQGAELYGARYEVCGRMAYRDPEYYETHEYLLFNPGGEYRWLAEEDGHWVLSRVSQKAPLPTPDALPARYRIQVGDEKFRKYETGHTRLVYVDGALPWRARVDEVFRYTTVIAPPRIFTKEATDADGVDGDEEVEYFDGTYLEPDEVWSAFDLEGSPPRPSGVHPAQPFRRSRPVRFMLIAAGIVAAVNFGLMAWSCNREGKTIYNASFAAAQYRDGATSGPFTIPDGAGVLALHTSAGVDNSWLYLDLALLDSSDQVVGEMASEVSYYSGYSGGESWTEGSRSDVRYFQAPPGGTYRLILKGSGGSGNRGPPKNESVTVQLRAGPVVSRYFVALFAIAGLLAFLGLIQRVVFELRRWSPVMEGD